MTGPHKTNSSSTSPGTILHRPNGVSDELNKLVSEIRSYAPSNAIVSFAVNGKLHINIDVRDIDDLTRLESLLPSLWGGILSNVQRGLVDKHPFLHRLTALVAL